MDNPKREWTLPEFAAEAAGPELWGRYRAALRRYYALLDGTPLAVDSPAEAVRERWAALRTVPQSFTFCPLLDQIEQFEAQIDARIREALQSAAYVVTGFVGGEERQVPARLFRDQSLRIWLDRGEVEIPDGVVFRAIAVSLAEPVEAAPETTPLRQSWRPGPASTEAAADQTTQLSGMPERARETPPMAGRRGRKPGSGTIDDGKRLRQMLALLSAGSAPSVNAAAEAVTRAAGKTNQSLIAEIARLRRKFSKQWGSEPPQGMTWADFKHSIAHELNSNSLDK